MIIYNVTTKLSTAIATSWLSWMQTEHIPEVTATGCFTHAIITRLLDIDDSEGPTYVVQYHTESRSLYDQYVDKHSARLRQKSIETWGNAFIAFHSVMQIVN